MPDAGNPDVNGISQAGVGGVPEVGGDSYEHESAADREALRQSQRRNLTLSLLAAGLGTLASRPPRGYKADGWRAAAEGGLAGLETYGQGEDRIAQEQLKRQALRGQQQYRMGELDYRNRSLESLDALRKLEVQHWGQQDKTKQEADAENARHHQVGEDISRQQVGVAQQRVGVEQARAGTEAARVGAGIAPMGADRATGILKAYRVPNAEDIGQALAALPYAEAMKNIDTAVKAQQEKQNIQRVATGDGVFLVVSDPMTGKLISKTKIGAPVAHGTGRTLADEAHDIDAGLKSTPTPPAATPAAKPTPTPAATPAVSAAAAAKIPAKPTGTATRRTYKGKPGWYDPSTHNFYPDA